jgi:hypothetical protein
VNARITPRQFTPYFPASLSLPLKLKKKLIFN